MLLLLQKHLLSKRPVRSTLLSAILCFGLNSVNAQLAATTTSTLNTNCNGTDCTYSGPSILINELMISPTPASNDGSISGVGTGFGVDPLSARGEWIELYNPNICEPVDISCYYLGNSTSEGNGGYRIPAGTIVPPAGFCLIRGANMTAVPSGLLVQNGGNVVELVVPFNINDPGVCAGGTRLWFPNSGGWFAFYDNNGIPQDAVTWGDQADQNGLPCAPALAGCGNAGPLSSYTNIPANRKAAISNVNASTHQGLSLQRASDGGSWGFNSANAATYATCNAACITPGTSTCTGTATVSPTGGTAPYTFQWDDSQVQTTATATALCEGIYNVVVTDDAGSTITVSVVVGEFVPAVALIVTDSVCIDGGTVVFTGGTPVPAAGQTGAYSGTSVSGASFNPATAGIGPHTITYTYTDQFGCTSLATDNITVNPLPVVNVSGNNSPYCVSTTPETFTLQPAGGVLSGPGTVNNTFIPATAGAGSHSLTYTYTDNNGCDNSTTFNVQVVASPTPTFSIPATVCIYNAPVPLTGTPAGGIFTLDGNSTPVTSIDPATAGTGSHTAVYNYTDANGCSGSFSAAISVLPRPALTLNVAANYCFETPYTVLSPTPAGGTLTGSLVSGNGLDLEDAAVGSYTVSYAYTDANGCENTIDQSFTVSPAIHPAFGYSVNCAQVAAFSNQTPSVASVTSYSWDFEGAGTSGQTSPVISFLTPGDYFVTLTATDANNCSYDTIQSIYVDPGVSLADMQLPNVITANGDNVNDYVEFSADFLECFTYKMYILNRWGNVVYEMSNSNNRFYGLDKGGKELQDGVYFYVIESADINCDDPMYKPICSGNITISR